jgi:hypothetical protein
MSSPYSLSVNRFISRHLQGQMILPQPAAKTNRTTRNDSERESNVFWGLA